MLQTNSTYEKRFRKDVEKIFSCLYKCFFCFSKQKTTGWRKIRCLSHNVEPPCYVFLTRKSPSRKISKKSLRLLHYASSICRQEQAICRKEPDSRQFAFSKPRLRRADGKTDSTLLSVFSYICTGKCRDPNGRKRFVLESYT